MKIRYFSDEDNGVELYKQNGDVVLNKTTQGVMTTIILNKKEAQAILDFLAIVDF